MRKILSKLFCTSVQKTSPTAFNKNETKKLQGKVALLTGGASGTGYSIAKSFLKNGLSALTIADIDQANGTEAIKKLTLEFGENKVMYMECDVTKTDQLDWVFQNTLNHFLNLDIVVNNAGIMNDAVWDKEIVTNIGGSLTGTLLGLQYMSKTCKSKGGIIVNVASILGVMPSIGFPVHTMTQYAIIGLTRSLGGHNQRTGIKIIGLCPGLTNSNLLKKAYNKTINKQFYEEFIKEVGGYTYQNPDNVGDGLMEIIDVAESGSVWFMGNNKPHVIDFPNIATMINNKDIK